MVPHREPLVTVCICFWEWSVFQFFSGYAGGLGKLAGPTGGYLIGFIAMALIGGIVMEVSHRKLIPTLIGWFIGTAVDYLLGTLWFMYIMHTTFMQTMAACVFPFIIGDCIKLIAGVMLGSTAS